MPIIRFLNKKSPLGAFLKTVFEGDNNVTASLSFSV